MALARLTSWNSFGAYLVVNDLHLFGFGIVCDNRLSSHGSNSFKIKKGVISSYLSTCVARELYFDRLLLALLSWGIVDLTWISHEATWIYLPFGIALALECFRIALCFASKQTAVAMVAYLISLPQRIAR